MNAIADAPALRIVTVDPLVDPRWCELLDRTASSAFHSPAWLRVLARTYDFDVRALVLLDEAGVPCAGLPYCRIDDLLGERIVALPFSDYCDPLVSRREEWDTLIGPLMMLRLPITIRPLRNELPLNDPRFTLAKQARWHGIDLRPDLDAHWARLHDSARRAIQKAQRAGVRVVVADGPDDLRTFFSLHLAVRKHKYRLLAQPYAFFQGIWDAFIETGHGRLLLAVHEDQVIGGVLYIEWRDNLIYKFNASAPDTLGHRPNDLLMWEGITYGKERGCTSLDLGLSDWDQEGLIRYKRKFATEERTISFLKHAPERPLAGPPGQIQALFGQLTDLLTDPTVPDATTERAGELLYRYFA